MASVKRLRVETPPSGPDPGQARFAFTDDYSIFDWGRMPDAVPDKGASLCTMGAYTFELLAERGVPTHYRGVVVDGDLAPLDAATEPPTGMGFDLARVPDLPRTGRTYDYDAYYDAAPTNVLVPLEVVFRNAVPTGSSLRRRATARECGLDRSEWPDGPVALPEPVVEFSTKLEGSDRYLDREEAARIAGPADLPELEELALATDDAITGRAEAVGLDHQDGKIECVLVDGEVRVADVAGTLDENRFAHRGRQLSKEVLRQYHRHSQPEWVAAVADAKAAAKRQNRADWRSLCSRSPDPLPGAVVGTISDLYASVADRYTGGDRFDVDAESFEAAAVAAARLTDPDSDPDAGERA